MSLSNPSQLLLRNEQALISKNPLVVGCTDNEFFSHLESLIPNSVISSFQTHYAHHSAAKQRYGNIHHQFSEQYANLSNDKHDLVVIYFPKSKQEYTFLLAMLAPHMQEGATLLVVGENKGGVRSTTKLSTSIADNAMKVDSARHCSLFSMPMDKPAQPFQLEKWFSEFDITVANTTLTVASLPGVFSSGTLDKGTKLLLENLPSSLQGKVLDFGCGAGIIGAFVKLKHPETSIEMLDVSAYAIASAQKTLTLNQLEGKVFASDGLSNVNQKYQAVISNPPFHQGVKTNYETTETFLTDISQHLNKKASLTIVANSFLRYVPIIKERVGIPQTLAKADGFSIYYCTKNL